MSHPSAAVHAAASPSRTAPAFQRIGLAVAMSAALLLSGCGVFDTNRPEPDNTIGWSAEQLYRDAKEEMNSGNWTQARTQLDRIQARYPFGTYAQQAMIDTAYAYWRDGSPEQARATIDRFQQQYPNHEATDYMLYLKGLTTFTPENAFLGRLVGQDPAERDPKGARESFDAFSELIQRFPESRYAADARLRMNWLTNTIAMNEVYTARYYFERDAYVAAINRAETVVIDFQGTPAAEEALYLMALSYERLGMTQLRDDTLRVLSTNYPQSTYLAQGLPDSSKRWWNPLSWWTNR